jgi:hypothetical protein
MHNGMATLKLLRKTAWRSFQAWGNHLPVDKVQIGLNLQQYLQETLQSLAHIMVFYAMTPSILVGNLT